MAQIIKAELWKDPRVDGGLGVIAITTNGVIRRDGAVVMGRGAAKQATERIPGIEFECGDAIYKWRADNHKSEYGFLIVREPTESTVGFALFQVKLHWRDKASLLLISHSVLDLCELTSRFPDTQFRINFPGIGFGRLARNEVEPLLESLPSNVTFCYR